MEKAAYSSINETWLIKASSEGRVPDSSGTLINWLKNRKKKKEVMPMLLVVLLTVA
jgi:hypothetical protein